MHHSKLQFSSGHTEAICSDKNIGDISTLVTMDLIVSIRDQMRQLPEIKLKEVEFKLHSASFSVTIIEEMAKYGKLYISWYSL